MNQKPAPTELVIGAFVLTTSSAFGQTYFIALFAPWLKYELGLTNGSFGLVYTVATIASAFVLLVSGSLSDKFLVRNLAIVVILLFATACLSMAVNTSAWLLLPIFFALRLLGQGWLGHLVFTGVGRWYHRRRGRMMSIAVLGFPVSEAIMPVTAVWLIALIGWRQTWILAAGTLLLVTLPMILVLLRREPWTKSADIGVSVDAEADGAIRHWTRAEVLGLPAFFVVVSGIVAPSFVMTGIFFHQVFLVSEKGWTLAWFAGWFPAFAFFSVVSSLAAGWLVDRSGAQKLLPYFLLPMAAGVAILASTRAQATVPFFMILAAITSGSSSTLLGSLWAELFGTRHLGAIRSVAFAGQVLASALAPGLIGLLLDWGVGFDGQLYAMVAYSMAAAVGLWVAVPRLYRQTQVKR